MRARDGDRRHGRPRPPSRSARRCWSASRWPRSWTSTGLGSGPIEAERIGEGHSNVTYLIRRGDDRMVLRRPPRPPLPPSAHDVLREARLLSALQGTDARTPRVLATCDDEDVLGGVPFYVMEEAHGSVITSDVPEALDVPEHRRALGLELVDALAEIHAVDWQAAGPGGLRQADRLPGAPAAPLQRAVGAQQDARAAGGQRGRPVAGRQPARVRALDDRARRLPAGQRDGGRTSRRRGWCRCSTGSWPRSATRWPTWAT